MGASVIQPPPATPEHVCRVVDTLATLSAVEQDSLLVQVHDRCAVMDRTELHCVAVAVPVLADAFVDSAPSTPIALATMVARSLLERAETDAGEREADAVEVREMLRGVATALHADAAAEFVHGTVQVDFITRGLDAGAVRGLAQLGLTRSEDFTRSFADILLFQPARGVGEVIWREHRLASFCSQLDEHGQFPPLTVAITSSIEASVDGVEVLVGAVAGWNEKPSFRHTSRDELRASISRLMAFERFKAALTSFVSDGNRVERWPGLAQECTAVLEIIER
jgi:hypothetical protein